MEMKRELVEGFNNIHMGIRSWENYLNNNNNDNNNNGEGIILNTITPCAACKLLRRRCAQECPFSPYFSPHQPHKFASVHKVFGASNVAKMLMEVPESQRADAANSLVYEANLRLRDPIYGCMGAISSLQHQVQTLQSHLTTIRTEILKYKYRQPMIIPSPSPSPHITLISAPGGGGVVSATATPPAAPPTPPHSQPPPLSLPPLLPPPSSSSIFSPSITSTSPPHQFNPISTEHISYFG